MNTHSFEHEHFPGLRSTELARSIEFFVLLVIALSVLGFIFVAVV